MIARFQKVRAINLAAPPSPFSVPPARLIERTEAARNELPARLRDLVAKAPILVEPYPSEDSVKEGLDPRTVGLFTGEPLNPEDESSQAHLEHILLFQKNLERDARSADELDEELRHHPAPRDRPLLRPRRRGVGGAGRLIGTAVRIFERRF